MAAPGKKNITQMNRHGGKRSFSDSMAMREATVRASQVARKRFRREMAEQQFAQAILDCQADGITKSQLLQILEENYKTERKVT